MLFVRKERLPSVVTTSTATSQGSYIQFTDNDGWTAGSTKRKISLSRATSTLSSGLYYIGVFNSAYARSSLAYTLTVNATANCSTPSSKNGSSTTTAASSNNNYGKYYNLKATRLALSRTDASSASSSNATSYVAFSMNESSTLEIGGWKSFSFEVQDASAKLIQFKLTIDNDLETATQVLPLLLVRGPNDDGFPTLFSGSQQDFAAVAARNTQQVVALPIETACSFALNLKDCFKVAVYNRQYSGNTLRFRLEATLFQSTAALFPSQTCGSTAAVADTDDCNGHGKCVLLAGTSTTTPSCKCFTGWSGVRCNSPKAFALPQLWNAIGNTSLLCSVCSSSFSLSRGEVKLFRVPESLRENSGVRLSVKMTSESNSSTGGGVIPSVYVSEVLPRSIYDFSHISTANDSSSSQVLSLSNASLTGHFWVVVYSEYPTSNEVEVSTMTTTTTKAASSISRRHQLEILHSKQSLQLLGDAGSSSNSASNSAGTFMLIAEVYELPDGTSNGDLITEKSFLREAVRWLIHTTIGNGVLIFVAVFVTLILSFCLWRICRAPENQDKQTLRHFGQSAPGATNTVASGMTLAPIGTAHVLDESMQQQRDRDIELGTQPRSMSKGKASAKRKK